jgi:hypothetical protein
MNRTIKSHKDSIKRVCAQCYNKIAQGLNKKGVCVTRKTLPSTERKLYKIRNYE